jgi:hypothetical protein
LLRVVRRHIAQPTTEPRIVGIDDFAWKRGHRYGTIIRDLEQRRIIDILQPMSSLDPFLAHFETPWSGGSHNSAALWRTMKAKVLPVACALLRNGRRGSGR